MNRDAKGTITSQTGDERGQNGNLPITALDAKVGVWTEDGRVLEIRRVGVLGDEALCFEFLDGDFGALREEEDVPIFIAHGVYVLEGYGWVWRWIETRRDGTKCDEAEMQMRLLCSKVCRCEGD